MLQKRKIQYSENNINTYNVNNNNTLLISLVYVCILKQKDDTLIPNMKRLIVKSDLNFDWAKTFILFLIQFC